ncbi:MAG: hypothetical protein Ct9H300mP19_05750 [Dehalococcoidia bacterium]|nr:MAG: hypothetical protein Ct9H300mP19_05750 [Dehalococcoidia bacterium]
MPDGGAQNDPDGIGELVAGNSWTRDNVPRHWKTVSNV